jgi:hypothetical protein
MGDFLVNAEDCGITTMNTIDAEMQALARYVAMGTVHSRQKRDADHQQRQTRRLATFSTPSSSIRNTRRRLDLPGNHHQFYDHPATAQDIPHAGTSDSFAELDFSGLEQAYIDQHLSSDVDTAMGAPEGLTTAPSKPEDNLVSTALANIEGLQELFHFESDNPSGTVTGLIDFSLLRSPKAPTTDATD